MRGDPLDHGLPLRTEGRRLILVTNREPYQTERKGRLLIHRKTIGGLVSALDPVLRSTGGTWVSGAHTAATSFSGGGEDLLEPVGRPPYPLASVRLTDSEMSHYYEGFCNRQLWPLFHSMLERCDFRDEDWPVYRAVNARFAAAAARAARPGDLVWIHDYQLCLVPERLRALKPKERIGFFLHIPFPHVSLFATLPRRREILLGILGSDVAGFQSPKDASNFLEAVREVLPAKAGVTGSVVRVGHHACRVGTFPIGVDFHFYKSLAESRAAETTAQELRREIACKWVALGIDRLDYSKGIWRRLLAVERFLEDHPSARRKFAFVQVAVPSRQKLPEYQRMRDQVELAVGRINGRFRERAWSPILYYYRGFNPVELAAYYRMADVALVTPLRDGMNLVAKEYAACSVRNEGSLVLSEFTGAAQQLVNAWKVNPYDTQQVAETLYKVLSQPRDAVIHRMSALRQEVRQMDLHWWVKEFLKTLLDA